MQFDEFHSKYKQELQRRVERYRDKLYEEKWEDYQRGMTDSLDEARKDVLQLFQQQLETFVIDKVKHIQGVLSVELCAIVHSIVHVNKSNFFNCGHIM